jgi:hypothetical protein
MARALPEMIKTLVMAQSVKYCDRRVFKFMPNKACTGQVGFCGIFKHFSGFEFFLLPGIVHARPPASNASRWAAVNDSFSSDEP